MDGAGWRALPCSIQDAPQSPAKASRGRNFHGRRHIDILFPQPTCLHALAFRNFYTSSVTVLYATGPGPGPLPKMETSIPAAELGKGKDQLFHLGLRDFTLMPKPHVESKSQDEFVIYDYQFQRLPESVIALRLILEQPSSLWQRFTVESIACFAYNMVEEEEIGLSVTQGNARSGPVEGGGVWKRNCWPEPVYERREESIRERLARRIDRVLSLQDAMVQSTDAFLTQKHQSVFKLPSDAVLKLPDSYKGPM